MPDDRPAPDARGQAPFDQDHSGLEVPPEPPGPPPEAPGAHGAGGPREQPAGPEAPGGGEHDDTAAHGAAASPPRGRGEARRRSVRRRRRRLALTVAATVVVVVAALVGWYEFQAHPGGSPGKAVVVSVQKGEGSGQVVSDLAGKGVVSSGLAYRLYLLIHGTPVIRPGSYLVHKNLSFAAATQALSNGPNVWTLDVLAGFTLSEVAKAMGALPGHADSSFLQVARSGVVRSPYEAAGSTNLEGLVAPGNYIIYPGESDRAVLQKMVRRFDQEATKAGATPAAAAALGVSPNQLITVASIVQKEGFIPENMPKVSRVIYNRLAKDMPLQMDSTVLYSLGRDGGPVTPADLRLDTPYNTYLHSGLTPTPIAIPGAQALAAAAHPPAGSWLFFVVVDKSGKEAFSTTYAGQLANEALAKKRGV